MALTEALLLCFGNSKSIFLFSGFTAHKGGGLVFWGFSPVVLGKEHLSDFSESKSVFGSEVTEEEKEKRAKEQGVNAKRESNWTILIHKSEFSHITVIKKAFKELEVLL